MFAWFKAFNSFQQIAIIQTQKSKNAHRISKSFLSFPIKQNAIKNISVDRNQIIIDSDIELKTLELSKLLANGMYYAFNCIVYSILNILTTLATFPNDFLKSISLMS